MIAFVTELNKDNFDTFSKTDLVLIDVKAAWCGPCKMIAPLVDELSNEYQGRLHVGKLDADDNRSIVASLNVRNIPTLILLKDGIEVERLVGAISKQRMVDMIEQYV